MFERKIESELYKYYEAKDNTKILIVYGARHIGKSYIIRETAKTSFKHYVLPVEIKSGNDQTNFRAIPKLVDPDGNYKIPLGFVFGNNNVVKKENNLINLPIYLIMFL